MKEKDEYIWQNYTPEYRAQLEEIKRDDKHVFFITDFNVNFNDNDLLFKDNLHPNWKQLYHTAFKLNPSSIFECGCGAGYHLKNLLTILPAAKIKGCDLLESQLDFAKEFSGLNDENLERLNLTLPTLSGRQYEFVFSQAVVMHLSTENAIAFLTSMKALSKKYVFLVEGIKNHENWNDLVKSVFGNEWEFSLTDKYIDYGILLTRKS